MVIFQANTAEEMQQEMITLLQHSIKQRESERNTTNRKGDLKQIDARVCELQTILGVLLSCRIEPKTVTVGEFFEAQKNKPTKPILYTSNCVSCGTPIAGGERFCAPCDPRE
jgi:hypothetical protein